jgi:hypothetical protein
MFCNVTNDPFKDSSGRTRTSSLFIEHEVEGYTPLWTIHPVARTVDGVLYQSLKAIYFSYDHIPGFEYDFAMATFKSWETWVRITNNSRIRNIIAEWREELDVKLKADAIRAMVEASKGTSAAATTAAKYLADKGYSQRKAGRPSKEEITRETRIAAGISKELDSDYERMGLLKIVN